MSLPNRDRDSPEVIAAYRHLVSCALAFVRCANEFGDDIGATAEHYDALERAQERLARAWDRESHAPTHDMAAPHVDARLPIHGGTIRLRSCSGPLEALWIDLYDTEGRDVSYDRATGLHRPAAVRVTPPQARMLAAALTAYADSHEETDDE